MTDKHVEFIKTAKRQKHIPILEFMGICKECEKNWEKASLQMFGTIDLAEYVEKRFYQSEVYFNKSILRSCFKNDIIH